MKTFKYDSAASAIVGLYTLFLIVFVIGGLYVGQDIIIPITVGILITFLLSPLVNLMEKFIGRIAAVLLVVLMIFSGIFVAGYILTREFVDLTIRLPDYTSNIEVKLKSFQLSPGGTVPRLMKTFERIRKSLPGASIETSSEISKSSLVAPAAPVQVVDSTSKMASAAQVFLALLGDVLFNSGLVMLLVIFMLLNREDLRARTIRLIGQGRIGATTRAMDDASNRVSHYLFMQLLVNTVYGILIGLGLYFIGIPHAGLWGGLIIILRFIPYIGTWIAAAIPVLLSFIISSTWATPILTIGLYLILDAISSNVVEPLVYGISTGVSSTALIISAVFWTLLWGPMGLLLATPITVCLVVIGRHVPGLEFLSILLSDEQPLEIHEEVYHRLLIDDTYHEMVIMDNYLKEHSILELCDNVLVPVLIQIEKDIHTGSVEIEGGRYLYQALRDIMVDISNHPTTESIALENQENTASFKILSVPARVGSDELASEMMTTLVAPIYSLDIEATPTKLNQVDIFDVIDDRKPNIICISVIPPSSIIHVRYLTLKLRNKFPEVNILIGLWGFKEDKEEARDKLRAIGNNEVAFSFAEAIEKLEELRKNEN